MIYSARYFIHFILLTVGLISIYQGAVALKVGQFVIPLGNDPLLEGSWARFAGWLLVAFGIACEVMLLYGLAATP